MPCPCKGLPKVYVSSLFPNIKLSLVISVTKFGINNQTNFISSTKTFRQRNIPCHKPESKQFHGRVFCLRIAEHLTPLQFLQMTCDCNQYFHVIWKVGSAWMQKAQSVWKVGSAWMQRAQSVWKVGSAQRRKSHAVWQEGFAKGRKFHAVLQEGFAQGRKFHAVMQEGFAQGRKFHAVLQEGFAQGRKSHALMQKGFARKQSLK